MAINSPTEKGSHASVYLECCIPRLNLFVCFLAVRPKSTAMVMAGRSVHLTPIFLGRLEQAVNLSNWCTYFLL